LTRQRISETDGSRSWIQRGVGDPETVSIHVHERLYVISARVVPRHQHWSQAPHLPDSSISSWPERTECPDADKIRFHFQQFGRIGLLLFAAHWCRAMLGRLREQWSQSSWTVETSIALNAIGISLPVHRLAPNANRGDKMCRKWTRDVQRDPWAMMIIQCVLPYWNPNSNWRYNVLRRLSLRRRAIVVCDRQIYYTKHQIYQLSREIADDSDDINY